MIDYYIGQVGIPPEKFWNYTWKEVVLLGEHWNINHNIEWERLRYLAATIYNARAEKRSQMVKPMSLFKLPQDKLTRGNMPEKNIQAYNEFVDKIKRAGINIEA